MFVLCVSDGCSLSVSAKCISGVVRLYYLIFLCAVDEWLLSGLRWCSGWLTVPGETARSSLTSLCWRGWPEISLSTCWNRWDTIYVSALFVLAGCHLAPNYQLSLIPQRNKGHCRRGRLLAVCDHTPPVMSHLWSIFCIFPFKRQITKSSIQTNKQIK